MIRRVLRLLRPALLPLVHAANALADRSLTARGVTVYADDAVREEAMPLPDVPRAETLDELWGALREGRAPIHDGRWSKSTLEVCLAMIESSRTGRDVSLQHQVSVGVAR